LPAPPLTELPLIGILGEPQAARALARAWAGEGGTVRMLCPDEKSSQEFLAALGLPAEAAGRVSIVRGLAVSPADLEALFAGAEGGAFLSPVSPEGRGWRSETHLEDVGRVTEAAAKAKVSRFVYLSTLAADSRSKVRCLREAGAAEKLVAGAAMTDYSLRAGVLVGRGDGFLVRIARQAASLGPFAVVWGYGDTPFQTIHEDDLGLCLARCLAPVSSLRAGTYCVSEKEQLNMLDLVDRVAAKLGRSKVKVHIPLSVLVLLANLCKLLRGRAAPAFRERVQLQWVGIVTARNDLQLLLGAEYAPKSICDAIRDALRAAGMGTAD
jgi:uncharacterized protein YbjT (DUF2867 family)